MNTLIYSADFPVQEKQQERGANKNANVSREEIYQTRDTVFHQITKTQCYRRRTVFYFCFILIVTFRVNDMK